MGIETVALIALAGGASAAQGYQSIKTARSQAKAVAEEGALKAENVGTRTKQRAGEAKASFLASGFDLFGTPQTSVQGIYQQGEEDVGRIITNSNRTSKNIVTKARNEAIMNLVKSVGNVAMGSAGGGGGGFNDATGGGFNTMFSGNTLANSGTTRTLSTGQSGFVGPLPK